jgi:serine/threonine protein kinase
VEDVPGYSLRDIMTAYRRRHELPACNLVLDWLEEACRSLGALHGAGVVHRAICPASVVLGPEGRVQLIGAGPPSTLLARDWEWARGCTESDASGYLAPEQRDGRSVDGRADLFALGLTFYELLTLVYPVTLVSSGIVPRPASAVNATVPPACDAVLSRMMALLPADRYSSAEEALAAVSGLKSAGAGGVPAGGRAQGLRPAVMPSGRAEPPTAPRAALIAAGAVFGSLVGATAGKLLHINVLAAVIVGSIVGAIVGCFVNPKV